MKKSKLTYLASLSLAFLPLSVGQGQDEGNPVVNRQEQTQVRVLSTGEGNAMVISGTSVDGGPIVTTTAEFMMPVVGASTFEFSPLSIGAGAGLGGNVAPDPFSLVNEPDVQKEIELAGSQMKQINQLQTDFQSRMRSHVESFSGGNFEPSRMKEMGEMIKQFQQEHREQIEDVLLPHQKNRLKQISTQLHLQNAGAAQALSSKLLAEALDISEEQVDRLQKRSKEIEEELKEKIEKLKEEAQNELLKELTPEQRSKLEAMTGKKYKLPQRDIRAEIQKRRETLRSENENRDR